MENKNDKNEENKQYTFTFSEEQAAVLWNLLNCFAFSDIRKNIICHFSQPLQVFLKDKSYTFFDSLWVAVNNNIDFYPKNWPNKRIKVGENIVEFQMNGVLIGNTFIETDKINMIAEELNKYKK
jgi:hypothetical protein